MGYSGITVTLCSTLFSRCRDAPFLLPTPESCETFLLCEPPDRGIARNSTPAIDPVRVIRSFENRLGAAEITRRCGPSSRRSTASGSPMRPFRPPAYENGGEAANVW